MKKSLRERFFILRVLDADFRFSKRQLGWLLLAIGVLGVTGILAIDVINVGREGGIGPAQRVAVISMAILALIGLSLIPLGDTPS
jgi:predicted MFS family arabinose efflux permease